MAPIPKEPMTFKEFEEYWAFAVGVVGVGCAVASVGIRYLIYRVIRGEATVEETNEVSGGINRNETRRAVMRMVATKMNAGGHDEEAASTSELVENTPSLSQEPDEAAEAQAADEH